MAKLKLLTASALLFCLYPITTSLYAETDAELMASGQWRDPKTGLIWMRCLVGQKWTGSTCSGDAKNVSPTDSLKMMSLFNQAGGFAGNNNWRLPTVAELSALRKCKVWDYDARQRMGDNGWEDISRTPRIINIPSAKGTIAIPQKCRELWSDGGDKPWDKKTPEFWQVDTKIFRGLIVHNFMDIDFPASSQPTQTQFTANLPLWYVRFAYESGVSKGPTYASSAQVALFAVRSGK